MTSQPPSISVLVRTAARAPIFLRRALASIAAQSVAPTEVIVCNLGGATDPVDEAVRTSGVATAITAVHHVSASPQAAAANRVLGLAHGAWIAYLDDDDTWMPAFLERTGKIIARDAGDANFGGVVTQTMAIYERVRRDSVRETGREPFNPTLRAVDLAALAVENQFTNNALVFRQAALSVIGPYREDLPALYDWEFNVRLAARYRLEAIPEMLACYHQRPADDAAPNTAAADFERAAIMIRNEWLRADLAAGRIGLGQLALAGESLGLRRTLARWQRWQGRIGRWLGRAGR